MRRYLLWLKENIETAIALALAASLSLLGIVDVVSTELVSKAIPLTLAVFAFALLRERWRQDQIDDSARDFVRTTSTALELVRQQLTNASLLDRSLGQVNDVLINLSAVTILTGEEIGDALEEARQNTDTWAFKGGTGTFTRVVTLPQCVDNARRRRRSLAFHLEILDPSNFELCERYAKLYRTTLLESPNSNEQAWTGDGTRRELLATILAACWYQERFQLLDIQIRLSSTITTFRWDLSSQFLIITQRGPRFPAMLIDRQKVYYDVWSTELRTSFEQCRQVPLDLARAVALSPVPTLDEAKELFNVIGIQLPDSYDDEALGDIVEKAIHDRDPYTRGAGDNLSTARAR